MTRHTTSRKRAWLDGLRQWWPLHRAPTMTRRVFWPVYVVLSLLGAAFGLWCMGAGHQMALVVWTVVYLLMVVPAFLKRSMDGGMPLWARLLVLTPVLFASFFALFVPAVSTDGDDYTAGAAMITIIVLYTFCVIPMLACALLPTKRR
ncbi:hypothetical protein [Bifidobacterium mongoliense]|uniref:hypothetical protein n=1 Tax=Bifidobacterium mongoliense TaxID=518643 RepID=UPI0030EEB081